MDAPHDTDDFRERVREAAIEAELETGEREETLEAARAHVLVRLARMSAGALLVLLGVVLMVLPGPGLIVALAGLTILAIDVPFARRVRDELVERSDRATGFVPPRVKRILVIGGVAAGSTVSIVVAVAAL